MDVLYWGIFIILLILSAVLLFFYLKKNRLFRERVAKECRDIGYGFHRMDDQWYLDNCFYPVKNNLINVI